MSYDIIVNERRIESVFGNAFPSLTLKLSRKQYFLAKLLSEKLALTVDGGGSMFGDLRVNNTEDGSQIKISIHKNGSAGYKKAVEAEQWIDSRKRLRMLSPPRFWNSLFYGRAPTDVFCLNDVSFNDVMTWLDDNVQVNEYQIFSKFDNDYTLGFRSAEHATMFKLAFGDKV